MTNKEKTIAKFEDTMIDFLESKYQEKYLQDCVDFFDKEFSGQLVTKDEENTKKLNKFASGLLNEISKNVYDKNKDEVRQTIHKEMVSLLNELFSDEESEQLYVFLSSDVGRKLIRNLDLFKDAYITGTKILVGLTMRAWSSPQVGQAIMEYMEKLSDESETDESEND